MSHPTPIGVLRSVRRPVYDRQLNEQVAVAVTQRGEGRLEDLLTGSDTWMVR
jgi:2-oxoglutarate ferredoxin oxidoreductase subunit beta